jgi:hypothetical protein
MTVLAYLGPIALDLLGDFGPSAVGDPSDHGEHIRLDGVVRKEVAEQLKELCDNRDRRQTFGEYTGILELLWVQNRPELCGPHLFLRCDTSASHMQQLKGWVSISLDLVALTDHELVIVRSARERIDGYAAKSLVVQPFWGENPDGEPFDVDPGGTAFSREYDERTEYDPASLIPEPGLLAMWDDPVITWDDPIATWEHTGRRLRIHQGSVT